MNPLFSTHEPIPQPPAPPLDMELFEEARSLMGEKFLKLLGYFLDDTRYYLNQMDEAIRDGRPAPLAAAAHSLKASSHQFGAMAMAHSADAIETSARNGQLENLSTLVPELRQQAEAIRPALESFLARASRVS